MNKVTINGNLTKDLSVVVGKNFTLGNFTIANNEGFGDNQKTNFVNCTIFGENRINALEQYLVKGCKVLIDGKLEIKTIEEGKGKNKEYKTYTNIIVDTLEIERFVGDK